MEVKAQISKTLNDLEFEHFQWIPLQKPLSFEFYQSWLDHGHHGDMSYLEESAQIKEDPSAHFRPMKSIITLTENYFPQAQPNPKDFPLQHLKIAHYAQQEDYHFWLKDRMKEACQELKTHFPNEDFLPFTDAVPLLERDHAYQGGLGWVGKNTCLINRDRGSFFFIAEILSTLDCKEQPSLTADFCGTCTRCMEACPTGALDNPRQLEAKKCIAYWTIEAKENPPEEIRSAMGDWLFGCDICQTVCPWNVKIFKNAPGFSHPEGPRDQLQEELRWVLTQSNKKLMKSLGRTPLNRTGGRGLKRNGIIVAANKGFKSLIPEIKTYLDNPYIGDVAQWALRVLSS